MSNRIIVVFACLAIGTASALPGGNSLASPPLSPVSSKRVDLCTVASTDTLQALLQNGIQQLFPILISSGGGEYFEISNPAIEQVSCPHLSINVHAEVRYRQNHGPLRYQTGGVMVLASPMVGYLQFAGIEHAATVTAGNLRQAIVSATNLQITALRFDQAPVGLDPAWMRACLSGQHADWGCRDVAQRMRFDVTQLVQLYLRQGLTL